MIAHKTEGADVDGRWGAPIERLCDKCLGDLTVGSAKRMLDLAECLVDSLHEKRNGPGGFAGMFEIVAVAAPEALVANAERTAAFVRENERRRRERDESAKRVEAAANAARGNQPPAGGERAN